MSTSCLALLAPMVIPCNQYSISFLYIYFHCRNLFVGKRDTINKDCCCCLEGSERKRKVNLIGFQFCAVYHLLVKNNNGKGRGAY